MSNGWLEGKRAEGKREENLSVIMCISRVIYLYGLRVICFLIQQIKQCDLGLCHTCLLEA